MRLTLRLGGMLLIAGHLFVGHGANLAPLTEFVFTSAASGYGGSFGTGTGANCTGLGDPMSCSLTIPDLVKPALLTSFSHVLSPFNIPADFGTTDAAGQAFANPNGVLSLTVDVTANAPTTSAPPVAVAAASFSDNVTFNAPNSLLGSTGYAVILPGLSGAFTDTCVVLNLTSGSVDCNIGPSLLQTLTISSANPDFGQTEIFDGQTQFAGAPGLHVVPGQAIASTTVVPQPQDSSFCATGIGCFSSTTVWLLPIQYGETYQMSWSLAIAGEIDVFGVKDTNACADPNSCSAHLSGDFVDPPQIQLLDANMQPLSGATINWQLGFNYSVGAQNDAPEPGSIMLMGSALTGAFFLAGARRKRRQASKI